ncbi:MAG: hypothetical protein L0I27_01085 [Lactococcus raffinolactis]|nr:hypothetical protein [Lactococcus raffinolactis]
MNPIISKNVPFFKSSGYEDLRTRIYYPSSSLNHASEEADATKITIKKSLSDTHLDFK